MVIGLYYLIAICSNAYPTVLRNPTLCTNESNEYVDVMVIPQLEMLSSQTSEPREDTVLRKSLKCKCHKESFSLKINHIVQFN